MQFRVVSPSNTQNDITALSKPQLNDGEQRRLLPATFGHPHEVGADSQ